VAYQLSAQPNSRIYVRPFPTTPTTYMAPEDADAHHPLWSPDGKALFYVNGPSMFASVTFTSQPSVSFGQPVHAPRSGFLTGVPLSIRTYDVLPDGNHFLGVLAAGQATGALASPQIGVVLNWFEEVRQRMAGK
jgi:hypothetical protein